MLTVENAAAEAARFVEKIADYPARFSGRGIVICAGGVKYFTCAWVLIKMLRILGCTLPIQVWYLGEDEGDPVWIGLAKSLGVECVDAFGVRQQHPHPRLGGWESKAYAILHSSFEEVLFLDADNFPVSDPTPLFDTPEYRQSGAVFWPDGGDTPKESPRWKIFGVPFRDGPEQESGQILIDKSRCWRPLSLCNWYNCNSDFYYQHIYGDKDTFLFAWLALRQTFAMPTTRPEIIPSTMCQFDFHGHRLFQHRTGDKWSLSGNRIEDSFWHGEFVRSAIQELRETWRPVDWLARHAAPSDRAFRDRLAGNEFAITRVGQRVDWLTLDRNGFISPTKRNRCLWWCENRELVVTDDRGRPQQRFQCHADGILRPQVDLDHPTIAPARLTPKRRVIRTLIGSA